MDKNFLHYNALDSVCTIEAHNGFWSDILPQGFQPAVDMTMNIFEPLMFMMTRGLKINFTDLEITKQQVLTSAAEKQEELNQLCGRELNVNSPKACQQYFYIELGIAPYYTNGKVTVDDLALQRLARGTAKRSGLRQAKLVQEIRGLQKLHGTYLNLEFDADGRMRSSYNPRGTKFGRLSSSKTIFGTGTNQQNLPQEFKRFVVADEGCVFWEVDKRQAEWVVVAYLSGDANMLSVVESGKDTHIHTAALMFGIDPEIIELEDKLVGGNTDPDAINQIRVEHPIISRFAGSMPRTMSCRQCGKKSNHGLNYDEGPNQFALINEIEEREAKRIWNGYHAIYPGIHTWHNAVQKQLQKDRTLTNCFGRKVRFLDSWGPDLFKPAYAMMPSSSVVDSLNIGMTKTYHDYDLCGISAGNIDLLAQVHDSILLQIPLTTLRSPQFALTMQKVYDYVSPELTYNGRTFNIATDSKLGLNWGGYHKVNNPQGMRKLDNAEQVEQVLKDLNV